MAKKKNNKNLRKMFRYFNLVKKNIIVLTGLFFVLCIINVFKPIVEANLLTYLTDFNADKLIKFAILLMIISVFSVLVNQLANKSYMKIREKILLSIRRDMIDSILDMKIVNFDKTTSGEFQEKVRNDPMEISTIFNVFQYSFFSMITSTFILGYVCYINIWLGLIYIFGVLIIYVLENYFYQKYRDMNKEYKKIIEKNNTILNEIMRGIRDIKLLNITKNISNIANSKLELSNSQEIKIRIYDSKIRDMIQVIEAIIAFITIVLGIMLVDNKIITVTSFILVFMYRSNIYDLVLCITTLKEFGSRYTLAIDRIFEVIDDKVYKHEKFGKYELNDIKGKIEFKNVNFAYDENQVLYDINFQIKPKETVAIVGASGSGKSTIFNLLTKSYDVSNKQIFIDDIDINDLSKDSIRNNISIISQNPYIFNLSIKDNFMLLDDKISFADIKKACEMAKIDKFIDNLPDKYDTLIGEGGVNLSGGQRQRLAIARALLKKSKIILFDEATSALDNVTQREIQNAIDEISSEYTILIIAHRLSTIKNCERIIVVDDGKIVGMGTHYELLKDNKVYKKLYENELEN